MKNYFFLSFFFSFFIFKQKTNSKINFINKALNYSRKNKKTVFSLSTLLGIASYSLYKIINNKYKYEQNDDKKLIEVNKLIQEWFEIPTLINDNLKNHINKMKNNLVSLIFINTVKNNQENSKTEKNFFLPLIGEKKIQNNLFNLIVFKKKAQMLKEKDYDKKHYYCDNRTELNNDFLNKYNIDNINNYLLTLNNHFIKKEISYFGLKINFDNDNFIIVNVDYIKEKLLFYEKLTKNIKEQYKKTLEEIYKIQIPKELLEQFKNKKLEHINNNFKPRFDLILKKITQNKNLNEDEEKHFEYIINYVDNDNEDPTLNNFFLKYKEHFLKK